MREHPMHARRSLSHVGRWVAVAFLLALLVWLGLLGWDAWKARADAAALQESAVRAQTAVTSRDIASLRSEITQLQTSADDFAAHTSGPHWSFAAWLPLLGDQVRPLQAASGAVSVLVDDALVPLSELDDLESLASPEFVDGRIDPFLMEDARPTLESADVAIRAQVDALAVVDTSRTVSWVADPFASLARQVGDMSALVGDATTLAQLLPTMLGGEEPRTYAVMVQNNAEPRASGGIPGAILMVTVDDGRLRLGTYYSADALNTGEPIEGVVTEEELAAFGEAMEYYVQDVNFTPQFPRAAELLSAFVERASGEAPDGVVSVDPVALGYILGDAPAQEISGIEITGDSLAEVMLNEAYFAFPVRFDQDAFFAAAANSLFRQVLSGEAAAVGGLQQALEENRFAVWSAVPEEQALLASTAAGGDLLREDVWAGVFVNDGSGSKIGYYVEVAASASASQCASGGGEATARIGASLTHGFEGDVESLPESVAGLAQFTEPGQFKANILFAPPAGYRVASLTLNDSGVAYSDLVVDGRRLLAVWVELLPGETADLELALIQDASTGEVLSGSASDAFLAVTPGAIPHTSPPVVDFAVASC